MNKCAFDRGFECSALNHKNCPDCKFYKTYEQLAEEQKISVIRLKVLDKWDYYAKEYNIKFQEQKVKFK